MVRDDLNLIIRDIREAHKKDSESAPQTTVADELKENLEAVENFKGSRDEKLVVLYCKQLGINYKNLSDEEADKEIESVLESVGLLEAIDKMPSELSGGMQKRAGLARTLILKPEIILYDEPTTGLDTITSREIIELILDMQKKYNTSSIIITHDMTCAKLSGDRINILKDGVIHSEGSYEELEKSDDEWVRSFFL